MKEVAKNIVYYGFGDAGKWTDELTSVFPTGYNSFIENKLS